MAVVVSVLAVLVAVALSSAARAHFGSNRARSFWIGGAHFFSMENRGRRELRLERALRLEDRRRGLRLCTVAEETNILPRHQILVDSSTNAWFLVEESTTGLCGWSPRSRPTIMWAKMGMVLVARARFEQTWRAVYQRDGLALPNQRRAVPNPVIATALVGYPGMQIPMCWSRAPPAPMTQVDRRGSHVKNRAILGRGRGRWQALNLTLGG